jgi:outer membrane protein assembly factor BamA
VTDRGKERNYRGSLQITYLLNPNVDLGIGGGGTRRDFVDDVPGSDEEDSTTYTGDASVSYRISPRFSSGVFLNTSHNTFDTSPDSRSYSGGLSARYLISPFYILDVRAGASYYEEDADGTGQSSDEWSPSGRVSLTYTWQYFQATLLGSYEFAGGGSFGSATKRGTVRISLTSQFAEGWWWDLSGYYQNNSSAGDEDEEDANTAEGTAGIRYAAAEWASFHLTGKIFRQRSDGLDADDIDRESVFLGITLSKLYRLY